MSDSVVCSVCGVSGSSSEGRCVSCGARLDSIHPESEEEHLHGEAQETFKWLWVLFSVVGFLLWAAIVLVALPLVIGSYDPQGLPGLAIAAGGWLVIAFGLASVSPGRTVFEPAVAAVVAVLPTILYLRTITDLRSLELKEQVFGALLGILFALLGGFLGDKLQHRRRPPAD